MSERISESQWEKGTDSAPPLANLREYQPGLPALLLRLVDMGLAGVLFLAPLFMGGRGDVGRCVYVALVCFTAVCWLSRQAFLAGARWRWSGAEWILLAAVLLVLLQLAPLPQGLLLALSPEIANLLPLWTTHADPGMQLGTWNQLTLAPQATRGGLVILLAHVLLFLVVVQRIKDFRDVERLLRWLALAAVGMAVLGLAQFLLGNGKFLWIYEHPFRDTRFAVKGTFQNQNHFAHFLVLGLGPLFWWLYRLWQDRHAPSAASGSRGLARKGSRKAGLRPPQDRSNSASRQLPDLASESPRSNVVQHGLAIGLGLVVLAGLLTFSRGGVIAMFTASGVCLGVLAAKKLLGRRAVSAIAATTVVLVAALAIYGYEPLAKRLAALRDARSMEEVCKGRNALWAAHLSAIPRFPLAGTGAGTHSDVYRTYLAEHFDVEFTHGENGYLHLLLETGFVGLTIMLAGAALAGFWCIRTLMIATDARHTVAAAALLSGLAASLVHSVGDFVWYIPACFSLTLVVAACACRLYQFVVSAQPATADARASRKSAAADARRPWLLPIHKLAERLFTDVHETKLARSVWLLATAGCVILAAVMLANRVPAALAAPHWDAYFTASRTGRAGVTPNDQQDAERTMTMVRQLGALLERDPYHARARVRLAGLLLQMFDQRQQISDNPMPLAQLRDAALAAPFQNREERDSWLTRAIGQNRQLLNAALDHARRAVRLCPLQGEGYVYLAELSFLQGHSATWKKAYIAQAMRVRPYTGVVLLAAGGEAALAGDVAKALALWKEAFHLHPECRTKIIEWFFPKNGTADQFITKNLTPDWFIKAFAPDRAGLGQLYYHCLSNQLPEHAQSVAPRYANALEADAKQQAPAAAAQLWGEAAGVHKALGDLRREEQCLGAALACTPDDLAFRRRLADLLYAAGRYEEAIKELQRLRNRNPDDQALRQLLETATRQRLNSGTSTIEGPPWTR